MAYTVQLENYQGPLDLLLRLIERNQLDICEVSLAQVTSDYLTQIEQLQLPLHDRNWFVDIASRLVLVKSRALLPNEAMTTPQEEESDDNLAEQLELYRLYRNASRELQKLTKTPSYGRSGNIARSQSMNTPTYKNLTIDEIQAGLEQALAQMTNRRKFQKAFSPQGESLKAIRAQALANLRSHDTLELAQLKDLAASQFELVVYFLCVLELIRSGDMVLSSPGNAAQLERRHA